MLFIKSPSFLVHGQWGGWESWSTCTVPCGFGRKYRYRECDNPKPAYDGDDCPFAIPADYIEGCNPYPCPSKYIPDDIAEYCY